MYFSYPINIPPNTDDTNPLTTSIEVTSGNLTVIDVEYPAGCQGLVGIVIYYHNVPIFPYNRNVYVYSDNRVIIAEVDMLLDIPTYTLEIVAVNNDDTYYHTPTIGITILRDKPKSAADMVLELT